MLLALGLSGLRLKTMNIKKKNIFLLKVAANSQWSPSSWSVIPLIMSSLTLLNSLQLLAKNQSIFTGRVEKT